MVLVVHERLPRVWRGWPTARLRHSFFAPPAENGGGRVVRAERLRRRKATCRQAVHPHDEEAEIDSWVGVIVFVSKRLVEPTSVLQML
jgi:hypothetical protein